MALRWTFLFAWSLLTTSGCVEPPKGKTKEEVIQEKVAERLKYWEQSWRQSCYDKALERATAIVDSTILARARTHRDTSVRGLIPPRPEKPSFNVPIDTIPLEPFLKNKPDTLLSN